MTHPARAWPILKQTAASAAVAMVLLSAVVLAQAQEPATRQPAANELPKAVFPPAIPRAEPNFDELFQDARSSYRAVLISELRFIRRACGLSDSQLKPIVHEAGRLLKETATKVARETQKAQRNAGKGAPAAAESAQEPTVDPITPVMSGLVEFVRGHVSAPQWSRFQDEISKRRAHRKRVAIANLVAKLDFHLVLSEQQRSQLSASLASRWNDAWALFTLVTSDGDSLQVPPIPDECVVPILTESQQKVWKRFPKETADPSADLTQLATELAAEQESEFDRELGKPRVEPVQGLIPF